MLSVCVAVYNGEKYIREQIESILAQIGYDDEIIISDDGSQDNTVNIITSFHDKRIILLQNLGVHGFVSNFENALNRAKGDVIFLADQDDIWHPSKVQIVLAALEENDIVVHNAELIDGSGKSLGKTYYSTLHHHSGFWANLLESRYLGCCMAFRKEVLRYCLPFPKGIVAHDYWIGMMGMTKYRNIFISDVLISYRRHGDNASPSSEKSNNSLYYKIVTKRMGLLANIIKVKVLALLQQVMRKYCYLFLFLCFCSGCSAQLEMATPLFPCKEWLANPYGVCTHFTQTFWDQPFQDSMIKAIQRANITNVRFDLWIPYSERLKDNKLLSIIDGAVQKNKKAGLEQLGILFVGWKGQRAWDKKQAYIEFLDTLLERYKDDIPYWEVMNEVNETRYSDSISIDSTILKYMPMLQLTYNKIKEVNSSILVTSTGFNDVYDGFIDVLSRSKCVDYFDILNFHVYDKPEKLPKRLIKIRGLMDKYQWEKPIWISECGMSTYLEKEPSLFSMLNGFKEEEQAYRIPRMYIISFAYGIDKVFTFSMRSREASKYNKEDHFGITHADVTPKPAYNAFKTLIELCPDGSLRPTLKIIDDVYIARWKRPDNKVVYALWTPQGEENVDLRIKGKHNFYDIFGKLLNKPSKKITISPSVVYIVGGKKLTLNIGNDKDA